jgi:hypothetical protein
VLVPQLGDDFRLEDSFAVEAIKQHSRKQVIPRPWVETGAADNDSLLLQQPKGVDDNEVFKARRVAVGERAHHVEKINVEPKFFIIEVGGHVSCRNSREEKGGIAERDV